MTVEAIEVTWTNPEVIETPEAWEPGIRLYRRDQHPNSCYIASYRDDTFVDREDCCCPDAADWPQQQRRQIPKHGLGHHPDELAKFIDEWHRWRRGGAA